MCANLVLVSFERSLRAFVCQSRPVLHFLGYREKSEHTSALVALSLLPEATSIPGIQWLLQAGARVGMFASLADMVVSVSHTIPLFKSSMSCRCVLPSWALSARSLLSVY